MATVLGVAAVALLCVAGVTLIGCGGGGSDETTPAPYTPLKIVSQTFNCKDVKFATDEEGMKVPDSGTYRLMIDMDQGRWRTDVSTTFKMTVPFENISFIFEQSSMFSAVTGRHTFSNHSIETVNGMPTLQQSCIYAETASRKTAAELKTCLDNKTETFTPVSPQTHDPDTKRYQMPSRPTPGGKVDGEYFVVDGSMVIKSMDIFAVVEHVNKAATTVSQTMADAESHAGAPPADVFEIPAAWGACKMVAIGDLIALNRASGVPGFLNSCAGLESQVKRQHEVVV